MGHNTARTDVRTADEAQPVDPLLVRQLDALATFAHVAPAAWQSGREHNAKRRDREGENDRGIARSDPPGNQRSSAACGL